MLASFIFEKKKSFFDHLIIASVPSKSKSDIFDHPTLKTVYN
jgi:hypothetical protein